MIRKLLRKDVLVPGFSRLALALSFLSAVADRLGLWGAPGQEGIAWGDFARFVEHTAVLTPWLPTGLVWSLAVVVTVVEVILAGLLLVGRRLRETALASAGMLGAFAVSMLAFTGPKSALDYSVLSACATALLLSQTVVARE